MSTSRDGDPLGLEFSLQRPHADDVSRIPVSRDSHGKVISPEVDADGDHVHFLVNG